ncbi:math-42 [Pristionchus pacificus]|uniref:MATH domain-containing protein n=1 Tax=Pristionchus pacificus TaxID=54126 RepID=A0A2A6BL06_PRIPA|nr:math-42 [Pristionchus pacificus]|eukprot:PDM66604.1 hypothetical protein PRIPAC_48021 [Pristionchus pacificus]
MIVHMGRAEEEDTRERALNRELSSKIIRIGELESELSEKEAALLAREESLLEKERQLYSATVSFKTTLALKNKTIENQKKELNDTTTRIHALETSMKEFQKELDDIRQRGSEFRPRLHSTPSMNDSLVIRAVFTGVSKIKDQAVFSKTTVSTHCKWAIQIRKNETHLELYLVGSVLDEYTSFNRRAYVKFRLLSHEDCSVLDEYCFSKMQEFSTAHPSWGKNNFITWEDLMSPSNKYVQDDSFIVEVWFKEIDVVK